ncbi:perforin-1-like [Sparus aurata]|uniref:Perforin-1-like n=1 Tax=Sparus aurata TaxID=8175 RepID=A0A671TGM2_SPAAU|nr:perforin-1-like [Sparus aurata]
MVKLWHLMLLCWAWSPPCLSSSVSVTGTPAQCEKAQFVPGYNLGGEGFDIVKMQRKGAYVIDTETWKLPDGTCRLYRNGYMNDEMQKVPVAVVDWRSFPKCSLKVSSVLYDSAESLVNASTSSVSNDWKVGLDLTVNPPAPGGVSFGGSLSKDAIFGMEKSKQDRYTFFRHSVDCNLYSYRLATKPQLSQEFKSAVDSLPSYSCNTTQSYRSLIDTYGTHFITQVFLGGEVKAVTSIKTCQATMNGLTPTEVNDCLSVEASDSSAASMKAMAQHCEAKRKKLSILSFNSMFNERSTEVIGGNINGADILFERKSNPSIYNNWLDSLKTTPGVIKYSLKPLHTILPGGHPAQAGLKQEVEKYIKKYAVMRMCSERCKIGHRSNKRDPCACVCNSNQNVGPNCCPAGKGLATLTVNGLRGKELYGDWNGYTDGSVVVQYGIQTKRTVIIPNNNNPTWPEIFQFGPINMNGKLEFTVYDEDSYWNSDLLGQCSVKLRSGSVTDSCMFYYGTFYFSYRVDCAPSLGGVQCQDYVPTPLSLPLAKTFHTRNSVLLGETGKQLLKSASQDEVRC